MIKRSLIRLVCATALLCFSASMENSVDPQQILARTTTAVQISVVAAPFSLSFSPNSLFTSKNGREFYSPGIIKVKEHRTSLSGWSIQGVLSGLDTNHQYAIEYYTEISTIGLTSIDGVRAVTGTLTDTQKPHTIANSSSGHGRGIYEIRVFYQLTPSSSLTYAYTSI